MTKKNRFCLIAAASINCNFWTRPRERFQAKACPGLDPGRVSGSREENASKQETQKERQMPYAVTSDNVRLYFEEAGGGKPLIFLHEFAADPTKLGAQMRYFSRRPPRIGYSARGYTPSDVPASAEVYTYKHFYTDALAVLDHLKIAKAHFVGLSMGSYSSLQIGLNAPERALSLTLAAVGSGSNLENLDAFRKQCRANAEQYETIGAFE